MSRTIQIDGVGNVEVDANFVNLSPADQERTINQIVSQHRQGGQSRPRQTPQTPPAPRAAPTAPQAPTAAQQAPAQPYVPAPGGTFGGGVDDLDLNGDGTVSDDEYEQNIRQLYPAAMETPQAPAGEASPIDELPPLNIPDAPQAGQRVNTDADKPEQIDDFNSTVIGMSQGALLNFTDEASSAVQSLIPGDHSVWNTGSFGQSYDHFSRQNNAIERAVQDEDFWPYMAGQVAGGLMLPIGLPARAANAVMRGGSLGRSVLEGVALGGVAGFGAGNGGVTERLPEAGLGAALGGAAGVGLHGIGQAASRQVRDSRFVDRYIRNNPEYAAMDAEIVHDLQQAAQNNARASTDPKGRATLTARQINSVARSYITRTEQMVGNLGLPRVENERLVRALRDRDTISQSALEDLRGSVAGDAVVDGITRYQRVQQLTPEIKVRGNGLLGHAVGALGGVLGASTGGAGGAAAGWGLGRYALSRLASGEAARVNAAERLLENGGRFRMLGERLGHSEGASARNRLIEASDNALAARDADAAMAATRSADRELEQEISGMHTLARRGLRNDLNLQRMQAGGVIADAKGTVADSTRALAAFNRDLGPTPKPTKPNLVSDGIDANIAAGIQGDTRTQQYFADQLGVPREDMVRSLEAIRGDVPDLGGDVARILNNYTTTNRNAGSVLLPRMRQYLENDGTMANIRAQGEAAATRASTRRALSQQGPTPPARPAAPAGPAPDAPAIPARGSQLSPMQRDLDIQPKLPPVGSVPDDATYHNALRESIGPNPVDNAQVLPPIADDGMGPVPGEVVADLPPQMAPIQRPNQYNAARDRNIANANGVIDRMFGDPDIPDSAFGAVGNSGDIIRDRFNTIDDALDYIDNTLMPGFEADGMDLKTANRIRSYLVQIAEIKPHQNQASLNASLYRNQ